MINPHKCTFFSANFCISLKSDSSAYFILHILQKFNDRFATTKQVTKIMFLQCYFRQGGHSACRKTFTCVKFSSGTRCDQRRQTSLPVPPPGELGETYASSLILAHALHYAKNDVIHKTRSTKHIDQATATGNISRKFGEIWTIGF